MPEQRLPYTVVWHHSVTHGVTHTEATSPEDAMRRVAIGFSSEFQQKTVMIAIEGTHYMRRAPQIVAMRGDFAILTDGRSVEVATDAVWTMDETLWCLVEGVRAKIAVDEVKEFKAFPGNLNNNFSTSQRR